MTQGCQAVGDPHDDHRGRGKPDPGDRRPPARSRRWRRRSPIRSNRGLAPDDRAPAGGHRRARRRAGARTTWCARSRSPTAIARALAVAEPVRAGQTIRFTLRDAIGARDDMKAMLDEQAEARDDAPPRFGVYFNCAGRGSALYGQAGAGSGADPRRFGAAAGRRDRELVRDRADLRPPAHPHVHRRPAARRLNADDGSRRKALAPALPERALAGTGEGDSRRYESYLSSHQKTVMARQWNASSDDCVTIGVDDLTLRDARGSRPSPSRPGSPAPAPSSRRRPSRR